MADYHSVKYAINDLTLIYTHDGVDSQFQLKPITEEELFQVRLKNKPTFILKVNDNIYYANIRKTMRFFARCGYNHLCPTCRHCSALDDEEGGCQKVRDLDISTALSERIAILKAKLQYSGQIEKITPRFLRQSCIAEAIQESKRIEKYPFVAYGFETFGTNTESLAILDCENFEGARGFWG